MTLREHILTCIAEECNEIAKVCSKSLRFGLEHIEETKKLTNRDKLQQELNDLFAMVELLTGKSITSMINLTDIDAKKNKFVKFLEYSWQLGTFQKSEVINGRQ